MLVLFYRWENWGLGWWSDISKVTQQLSAELTLKRQPLPELALNHRCSELPWMHCSAQEAFVGASRIRAETNMEQWYKVANRGPQNLSAVVGYLYSEDTFEWDKVVIWFGEVTPLPGYLVQLIMTLLAPTIHSTA